MSAHSTRTQRKMRAIRLSPLLGMMVASPAFYVSPYCHASTNTPRLAGRCGSNRRKEEGPRLLDVKGVLGLGSFVTPEAVEISPAVPCISTT
eukprot:2916995-Rhodomonas_salina.2